MARLDLGKFRLNHLANKNLRELTNSELNELMAAFAQEDIAPTINLPAEPKTIGELLNRSNCKGCGKCCLGVNTVNPAHPGLEVYEDELKLMGKQANVSYKFLKKRTHAGQILRNPENPQEVAKTRWLPFPCIFYDQELKRCTVYEVRPLVCKIYPVTIENSLCVKVNCEYGKDIYRSYVCELKKMADLPFRDSAAK